MSKFSSWVESKLFWLKTGIKTEIANGGKEVEEVVIRYKDMYFYIMLDKESGEPINEHPFGWSNNPMTPVPIRDFYVAVRKK